MKHCFQYGSGAKSNDLQAYIEKFSKERYKIHVGPSIGRPWEKDYFSHYIRGYTLGMVLINAKKFKDKRWYCSTRVLGMVVVRVDILRSNWLLVREIYIPYYVMCFKIPNIIRIIWLNCFNTSFTGLDAIHKACSLR